jgi:hypothetical protein
MVAQAEQANEHDEKQGNVGDEHGDYVKFRGVGVALCTGRQRRHPRRMELGMGISLESP